MIFSWFFPFSIYSLSRTPYHFSLLTLQSTLKSIFHLNIIWVAAAVQLLNHVLSHGLQHARFRCPPLSPWVCSKSCPLSQWCYLTISSSAAHSSSPSIFPSIRVLSNESVLIRWPKYWSFSFNNSPSSEYSEVISFRIDWFDLLAVQGILKSLLPQHILKASVLQHSAFFMVQLSYPYMTTGKTIALTMQTFVSKMMPLLFNKLRFS